LIVLTSNLGSEILANEPEGELLPSVREKVMQVVRGSFRPEFLNRLDEILLFQRLTRGQMAVIVDIQLERLRRMLGERKVALVLDDKATAWLGNAGYDPVYGARPLKRVIQRSLQNPLAQLVLEGKVLDGDTVDIGANFDGLEIKIVRPGGPHEVSAAA
jgi:ATP-dependent Clp protease ATP-binding subunit ClpB